MPETFNPYHSWLGLSPKIKNPHHFQLLGVSTKLTDRGKIKEAVDAGVRRNLALLAKVSPGQHDALLDQLKQRISIARATLLDPATRDAYLTKLKQQIKNQQMEAPPAASRNSASPMSGAQNPPVAAHDAQPRPDVAAPDRLKPMQAIPMAVPLNAALQKQIDPNAAPVPVVAAAISNQPETGPDDSPLGAVKIDPRGRRKRKRSTLGTMVAVAMLIMAGVGGFLIYQNFDALLELAGVNPDAPVTPGVVEEGESAEIDSVPNKLRGADELSENPSSESKLSGGQPLLPKLDLDKLPELTEMDYSEFLNPDEVGPDEGQANTESPESDNENPEENNAANKTIVRLDESQLAKMRRQLQRARRSLLWHDPDQALNLIESANEILEEVVTSDDTMITMEQAPIARLVEDTREILNLTEGFWQQVVTSCQSISGGQEIRIGEQIVGFLEADQERVTIRNAGTNIVYQFSFCPPGLAMALAEQGTIPDLPVWSKQLAAFYAINQADDVNHLGKIDELLRVAEEAGHDCGAIRRFAAFQFGPIGKPKSKIEQRDTNKIDKAVAEFRAESSYDDVDRLTPGMAGMYAEFILQIDSPNFEQHVAFLEEARRLAIRGGEASKVEDAILEMEIYAEIDAAGLMCQSFVELSHGKLTPEQFRQLMERAIPFLKSSLGKSVEPKNRQLLANRLLRIAEANGMLDATRRLNQLD